MDQNRFIYLILLSSLGGCKMVDQMYEASGTGITLVAVGLTVILIIYFLGRLRKKSK